MHATELAGTALAEGTYVVSDWAEMLLCDNIGVAPAADGSAHPIFGYIGTQCGIDVGIGELLAMAGASAEEGPLLASVDLVFKRPLRVGAEYRVTGEILDLVRKQGRRSGAFDLLSFVERMIEADGSLAVECTNVFVLPRQAGE